MKELQRKKQILEAIRNAIANINLEQDFDININEIDLDKLEEKVLKIGGYKDELGGISLH